MVPPACRRPMKPAHVTLEAGVATLEGRVWTPRHGARHLVPSLSLLGGTQGSFRFELSAWHGAGWTPWVATATIGPAAFPDAPSVTEGLRSEVDIYTAPVPVRRVRLRARVEPAAALAEPWILSLSTSDLEAAPSGRSDGPAAMRLAVPARSQMEEASERRDRICSPTCVAMVLEFWGRAVSVPALAAEIFHQGLDLYGVWPAAIHAAARQGVAGFLLRFPDWASASWCLRQGVPIIASIRFEPGELTGAPISRTNGHLVVLAGTEGDHVLVNDPAAPSSAEVPRRYRRQEFCRAWL